MSTQQPTNPARPRFDLNHPDAQRLRTQIIHGAFLTEGTMVAFPLCFPGMSVPPPADESRLTALDVAADGNVYAASSGRAAHLLVGLFHGVTGMVFDMGTVSGTTQSAAICCGRSRFVAAVNGPHGGQLVGRKLQPMPFDLIQEWGFSRSPLEPIEAPLGGEPIVHMVADAARDSAIGITPNRLFRVDIESGAFRVVAEISGRGRLTRSGNTLVGVDQDRMLWTYDTAADRLTRRALRLPPGGQWQQAPQFWAPDAQTQMLYTADDQGQLFSLSLSDGFAGPLGRTLLAPVGPMAVTHDGRLFGTCGEGIGKLFCYEPASGEVRSLGVAASVLERRRYGYQFGDAVVGRDGQIIFGEDDDLGHLWLYFPRISAGSRSDKTGGPNR